MLRTAPLTTAAALAFAVGSLTVACAQTCKCDGDLCIDCSGTTFSTQPPDAGNQATIDATSESTATDAGADAKLATTTDGGDADVDGCVCSRLYGPCGALSPCGCCPGASLYCASNSYCFFVAH